MHVDTRTRYTIDDLWNFPDDGHRRELIDGVLYVSPLARTRHQVIVGYLTYLLWDWTELHDGTVFPGVNVDLDRFTHLEPDVAYTRPGREVGDVLGLDEPPDLVIEVSSPSTRRYDLGVKRDRYATAGAAEFWFVDLADETIVVSVLRDGEYGEATVYDTTQTTPVTVIPGLEIGVEDVLRHGR